MERIAVIGNAGGGKSTLARALAARHGLPCVEVDALLWRDGWQAVPVDEYEAEHARLIAQPRWIIDGLGRLDSIAARLDRCVQPWLPAAPAWWIYSVPVRSEGPCAARIGGFDGTSNSEKRNGACH